MGNLGNNYKTLRERRGNIKKTFLGVITIGVINNGLSLMQVSSYWQTIAMGFIILVAVAFDQISMARDRNK